jgi:fumarate reductase subunit C
MDNSVDVIAGVGLHERTRKSRWPARLDFVQSASGLFLGLFMWGHMAFVSTILISNDAMYWVTKMFEGQMFFDKSYPGLVGTIVALVTFMFVLHGLLAMRKFPANYHEYKEFSGHRKLLRHEDTTLWWIQAVTGFALFFLASVHLYQMLAHPGNIGPYESADRVWSGRWWPLYLLKRVKWGITVFFLVLGLTTLAAYMKLGHEHRDRVGERYVPSWAAPGGQH